MRRRGLASWLAPAKGNNRAVISAVLYSLSTTLLNLANKVVFTNKDFNYPLGTIVVQNTISLFALLLFLLISPVEKASYNPAMMKKLLFPMACFCMFIYSNAKALWYISLPVLTVLKSFAPLGVSVMEVVFFGDSLTPQTALCMLLVVASNYVTASSDQEFSARGYAWAGVNVASNVAYLLSLRKCLTENYGMVLVAMHSTLISLVIMVPISVTAGDFPAMLYSLVSMSLSYKIFFLGSGILATGITLSTFWCLAETNGGTLSFLGAMNKIPIVLLGAYLFNTKISVLGWVGIFISILAGYLFARMKMTKKRPVEESKTNCNDEVEVIVRNDAEENGLCSHAERRREHAQTD
eukprot:CAMPEP_0198737096 /NCGR_PEP_ID=MMETSP1475-20131203/67693_1 /TAXON_ID= ORGANISM="Unidentified sp., Strain CCMP1999" /NCGR_SAMPLE_ID=MMETSP1475 /ASSEMBLY_ACC=CAM_ASM_001111 /LENGTH=351 /DNA_ID=CAMNT_0044500953 /DNA_START=326 /DNA_END=1381 /DNA_ORIENTATION=+